MRCTRRRARQSSPSGRAKSCAASSWRPWYAAATARPVERVGRRAARVDRAQRAALARTSSYSSHGEAPYISAEPMYRRRRTPPVPTPASARVVPSTRRRLELIVGTPEPEVQPRERVVTRRRTREAKRPDRDPRSRSRTVLLEARRSSRPRSGCDHGPRPRSKNASVASSPSPELDRLGQRLDPPRRTRSRA